ncbi:4-(cytidine 5'-diphospho)-2-C-methyl-D-erythritol kinase [Thermotoga sp. KOL6]|uniref:4-(cytidine 5'-diphospho)-2-C-methyl-D-erythritol kinase n=1 Tax=Thermotoga sp. KOL6 TaxID=126741 RepID=UPI000CA71835|nr:4-(cytidine 5'-diphospho)-2-C-methyl-D-erythritol kinase [Thermotoga sp. KOL6]PLV60034.1 4-diphosphocytidyl-2C-methyl-D-erythritol kinase [Thermotoga sp. KOL6]
MVKDSSESFVELISYAKINLYLDVLSKRSDGYHDILGLFQTISLHDTLMVKICEEGFVLKSNVELPEDNTLRKSYEIFKEQTNKNFGLEILLEKRIPMGSGLGGGSSNAAVLLKYLGKIFNVSSENLREIAIKVGSDVPFFLYGGTAIVRGKGEIVEKVEDISGYSVDLLFPNVHSSTKEMYDSLTIEMYKKGPNNLTELHKAYLERDYETIRKLSYNVFEEVFLKKHPYIKERVETFGRDAILKMMTGSGSTFFALYPSDRGDYSFVGGV